MPAYTIEDAELFIKNIRNAVELHIISPEFRPEIISEQLSGYSASTKMIIRLLHHPTGSLRASVTVEGPPAKAIPEAAASLAVGVPEGRHISVKELNELSVDMYAIDSEVELPGKPMAKRNAIVPGRDGITVEYGIQRGMVMPLHEKGVMSKKTELLEAACSAAGLDKNYWKQPKVRVYKFEAQRFIETSPNGKIKTG